MYHLIEDLPIDYNFSSKSSNELKPYGQWFKDNKDQRLNYLTEAVQSSHGFESWQVDFSPESLKTLGDWLFENVETEKLSEKEYKAKRKAVPDYISINDWDLTIKTRSLLVDVGIYLGEVFIKNHDLKWEQFFSKIKNHNDHGHMVITGFGKKVLNPIWIIYIMGLGFADKTKQASRLFETYERWKQYL
ncbi:MAG: hypothetical protein RIC06_14180 [Cyclobacteriaceae bacterium]